jgi:hypothetical protein
MPEKETSLRNLARELRPHALWEVIRWGLALLGSAMITGFAALWHHAKHLPPDLYFLGGLFVVASLVLTTLLYVARTRVASKSEIAEIVNDLLAKKGLPDTLARSTTVNPGPDISATGDGRPVLDGEIYRIVTTGKSMAAELTRSLYETMGRVKEFAIDVDVLVEMYVVNTSTMKKYIRDFTGTVEVDGKTVTLVRQKDFYAWEFNNHPYEYCLRRGESQFDRSDLETLPNLSGALNTALEGGKPIEGWIRFLGKDLDPEKLTDNRSYKFFIVDSLGNEHPILRAVTTRREGQITARQIHGR